jgi:hypothetical protein
VLRGQLRVVVGLEGKGRMTQAAEAMKAISNGKVLHDRTITDFTKQIEDIILERGGFGTAKALARKLVNRPVFKRLVPFAVAEEDIDKKARDSIIAAARGFLTDIMVTRGRRTAVNSNAFWVAATALIPPIILANRQGRATMRLLGVNAKTVRKAVELRRQTERERRWVPIVAGKHKRIASALIDWWHGPGSTIDTSRKIEVRIGHGEKHPLRYADATNHELRQSRRSPSSLSPLTTKNLRPIGGKSPAPSSRGPWAATPPRKRSRKR